MPKPPDSSTDSYSSDLPDGLPAEAEAVEDEPSPPARPICRSGHIALVGRPNVGKSTLLNALLGQKISIVTHKAQTTRQRVIGIKQVDDAQLIFVDTPGIHKHHKHALNRHMNRAATTILPDVDIVLWLLDSNKWTPEDEAVLEHLKGLKAPIGLLINKVDQLKNKDQLLPLLQRRSAELDFAFAIPVSATKGSNLAALEQELVKLLPEAPAMYPQDQITDISSRFLAAELIREKLLNVLQQEIPYGIAVEIERFEYNDEGILEINGLIWVNRQSHKSIVIGKGGAQRKTVGRAARLDMNTQFDCRVHLEMWVKVKTDWADDERSIRSLGLAAE